MRVRRAEAADKTRLVGLERSCDGAPHWSSAVWDDVLQSVGVERVVYVSQGDRLTGFVVVSKVADVAEIESLGVVAEARRQGVARALCGAAIQWAKEGGSAGMELEVRAGNEAALQLYAGLGFVEQGRRSRYYRAPVEDAVMMRMEF